MADAKEEEAPKAGATSPVERVREAAKWLIGAFAAIGALLVAGVQLSDAGALTWDDDKGRLLAVIVGLVLGLGGVMAAILVNVRMLLPSAVTLKRLETEEGLKDYFDENPELIPGRSETVTALATEYRTRSAAYDDAVAAYENDDSDANKTALETAKRHFAATEKDVREVLGLANWKATEKLFNDDIRLKLCGAAALAAVGIGLFAWAANPPEDEKSDKPVFGVAPNIGRLAIVTDGDVPLRAAMGARCELAKVRVLVVGGSKTEPEVVTVPRAGCDSVRFVVTPQLATFVAVD